MRKRTQEAVIMKTSKSFLVYKPFHRQMTTCISLQKYSLISIKQRMLPAWNYSNT